MKLLLVGDVHATQQELPECEALLGLIDITAKDQNVDGIVFMGDQTHNHSVMNVYVMSFWQKAFSSLCRPCYVLVGNHDRPGNGDPQVHSMQFFKQNVTFVSDVFEISTGVTLCGFQSNADFVSKMESLPVETKTVLCHQTFLGAKYENGFFATDGVDLADVPKFQYISGHIHTPHTFANVYYIGAPRWRTLADANVDRFLYVMDFDLQGSVQSTVTIPTSPTCRPIVRLSLEEEEGSDTSAVLSALSSYQGEDVRLDITGSRMFVNLCLTTLENRRNSRTGIKIRTFVQEDKTKAVVSEKDGIDKALISYVEGSSIDPEDRKEILKMVEERILCQSQQ